MKQLSSNQGSEFVNTCIDSITTMLGVQIQITSAYHPQTQGQREKDNRTFKDGLSKLVNKNEDDWDTLIPFFLYTHHSSVHASTKVTPFEGWFGRKSGVFNKSVESAEYEEVCADTLADMMIKMSKLTSLGGGDFISDWAISNPSIKGD